MVTHLIYCALLLIISCEQNNEIIYQSLCKWGICIVNGPVTFVCDKACGMNRKR